MSDGLRSRPYAISNGLEIAAKNAPAKLGLGFAEREREDGATEAGRPIPRRGRFGARWINA